MIPNEYDLRIVEDHFRERRKQAATYRLAQAHRLALVPGPTLLHRLRALMSRLHLTRSVTGQAKATA